MDINAIKGVGKKKRGLLNKLGLFNVEDMIYDFPRKYKDRSKVTEIHLALPDDKVLIRAVIEGKVTRNSNLFLNVVSGLSSFKIIFMNQYFLFNSFQIESEYYFYGKIGDDAMFNPEYAPITSRDFLGVIPVYNLTRGIGQKEMTTFHEEALKIGDEYNLLWENLPKFILEEYSLPDRKTAVEELHRPPDMESTKTNRRRISIEELYAVQLRLSLEKEKLASTVMSGLDRDFKSHIPFQLTEDQTNAVDAVFDDLESGKVMNRLVQGDVGSGKSIVAFIVARSLAKQGFQTAIMAPTTILANQLQQAYIDFFGEKETGIITSKISAKERKKLLTDLENNQIKILFGTHAIIEDRVKIPRLALVVTDEQQRFGIIQRRRAISKGLDCHSLYLSATPIPRTLALCFMGDLDISVIKQMPMGRKPIITQFIKRSEAGHMFGQINRAIARDERIYFISPVIEEGFSNVVAVRDRVAELLRVDVGMLHGQLPKEDAQQVMEDFRSGKIQVLCSTTMVEVGVDVPEATIMVILSAERFGLSQLHQLRGRVGRSERQSYCYLMSDSDPSKLDIIINSNDGYDIAMEDLKNRGPGSFFGSDQSGDSQITFDFTNEDLSIADTAVKRSIQLIKEEDEEMLSLLQRLKLGWAERHTS